MNQPRMNIFAFAHKGLRLALSKLTVLAGKTDYANEVSLEAVKNLTAEILELLHLHAEAEDTVVLPALDERVPGSTDQIVADHKELESSIAVFSAQLDAITPASPPGQGAGFYVALFHFYANYLIHMSMEETEVNPLIWDNFTDEEIMTWQGKITSGLTAEQVVKFYKYMVPALNPQERVMLLSGFKANAPEALFDSIMTMLELNMLDQEYAQLKSSLIS